MQEAMPPVDTAGVQSVVEGHAPGWVTGSVRSIEEASLLDPVVEVLGRVSERVLPSARVENALRGNWAGHALHPLLTDFPLGAWLSASLLDIFGGRRSRPAATGLVGFGLAMAVPTAAAGLAEWKAADPKSRRVGVVHASINGVVSLCYLMSLVARLRGRHRRGAGFALAGGAGAWVSGYLGGHLSLVRKIGTADPAFGDPTEASPAPSR